MLSQPSWCDVKQSHCYHPEDECFPFTTCPEVFCSLHNKRFCIKTTDLFRNNMSIHLPFYLLKSGCDRGEFGCAYRLVQDLLAVPAERQRHYRVTQLILQALNHYSPQERPLVAVQEAQDKPELWNLVQGHRLITQHLC